MGCDLLGIEKKLSYKFLTNKSLEGYDFKSDFKNYEIRVNAEFEIRRIGMKT